jgi:hypothetical protein
MLDFWKIKAKEAPASEEQPKPQPIEPMVPILTPIKLKKRETPKVEASLDKLKCHGCGVELQHTDQDHIGYIGRHKVSEHLQK